MELYTILTISGILLGILIILGLYIYLQVFRLPANNPKAFNTKSMGHAKRTIVCIGDSITHGRIGGNYVDLIGKQLDDYHVVNAGINGELVWNVLNRIDSIINCSPDIITILVGTNDANASLSEEKTEMYVNRANLPQKPNRKWFEYNYIELVKQLQTRTNARIIVLSIPSIGENLVSLEMDRSITYSNTIKQIASDQNVDYIPLNEEMIERLKSSVKDPSHDHTMVIEMMLMAIFKHYVLLRSWDNIAEAVNYEFHIDPLHLSNTGAKLVSDLILKEIK